MKNKNFKKVMIDARESLEYWISTLEINAFKGKPNLDRSFILGMAYMAKNFSLITDEEELEFCDRVNAKQPKPSVEALDKAIKSKDRFIQSNLQDIDCIKKIISGEIDDYNKSYSLDDIKNGLIKEEKRLKKYKDEINELQSLRYQLIAEQEAS